MRGVGGGACEVDGWMEDTMNGNHECSLQDAKCPMSFSIFKKSSGISETTILNATGPQGFPAEKAAWVGDVNHHVVKLTEQRMWESFMVRSKDYTTKERSTRT